MNPVDHPHGGGEEQNQEVKPPLHGDIPYKGLARFEEHDNK